jgi:methylated-DNA-[protein]-cysteine S-methyltransferase
MKNPKQSAKSTTPFQQRVYFAAAKIPRGYVTTYACLAAALGCGSARAVGQALGCNPSPSQTPCHRIVKSDGTLGGYFKKTTGDACKTKRSLLEGEGVTFTPSGRVHEHFILRTLKADQVLDCRNSQKTPSGAAQ